MLRKLIVLTAVAGGMSIAGAMTLAVPALAKGPSQASITGPGLAHAIVVSGEGEPGQQSMLANLAEQTNLFTAMFGPDGSGAPPEPLGTPPPKASLGPRYTVVYTVPGIDPQPGDVYGRVRQDLYPRATGGPVTYTPPGQRGFGQDRLAAAGWLRGGAQLTDTLTQLGVPPRSITKAAQQARRAPAAHTAHAPHSAAAQQTGSWAPGWIAAFAAAIAAAALAGAVLWLRHRTPANRPGAR